MALTRRELLGVLAGTTLGTGGVLAAGAAGAGAVDQHGHDGGAEPFYGTRQGGITTRPQTSMSFAAFDMVSSRRSDLEDLLRAWTATAAALTASTEPATVLTGSDAHGNGEAQGIGPARLTVTFGFGCSLFELQGEDRFGLSARKPPVLIAMPIFPGDRLEPRRTGGDLTVQACADDPQIAFHAVRIMAKVADGVANLRWVQRGFNETAAGTGTARDLLGFKDGISNPRGEQELQRDVWVGDEGPAWLRGGTYLIMRRVRIAVEEWDELSVRRQERIIGRFKGAARR